MKHDPHSFTQPLEARVTHLNWNAFVDFKTHRIRAQASWQIQAEEGAREIVLDTRSLVIAKVTVNGGWPTVFRMGEEDPLLGQALVIEIKGDTRSIEITYETGAHAEALQWLEPQQTAGKQHPFLFTQSQAILARSWVPCQDSPGVRFTYEATLRVPKDLLAVMSAENPQAKKADGIYHFNMPQPVPAYLLAVAVGDLEFRPFDTR